MEAHLAAVSAANVSVQAVLGAQKTRDELLQAPDGFEPQADPPSGANPPGGTGNRLADALALLHSVRRQLNASQERGTPREIEPQTQPERANSPPRVFQPDFSSQDRLPKSNDQVDPPASSGYAGFGALESKAPAHTSVAIPSVDRRLEDTLQELPDLALQQLQHERLSPPQDIATETEDDTAAILGALAADTRRQLEFAEDERNRNGAQAVESARLGHSAEAVMDEVDTLSLTRLMKEELMRLHDAKLSLEAQGHRVSSMKDLHPIIGSSPPKRSPPRRSPDAPPTLTQLLVTELSRPHSAATTPAMSHPPQRREPIPSPVMQRDPQVIGSNMPSHLPTRQGPRQAQHSPPAPTPNAPTPNGLRQQPTASVQPPAPQPAAPLPHVNSFFMDAMVRAWNGQTRRLSSLSGVIALHFFDPVEPLCLQFAAMLSRTYRRIASKTAVEVVTLMGDAVVQPDCLRSDWYTLVPNNPGTVPAIASGLGVGRVPALVLFDGASGRVLTTKGVERVEEDPLGLRFPWAEDPGRDGAGMLL